MANYSAANEHNYRYISFSTMGGLALCITLLLMSGCGKLGKVTSPSHQSSSSTPRSASSNATQSTRSDSEDAEEQLAKFISTKDFDGVKQFIEKGIHLDSLIDKKTLFAWILEDDLFGDNTKRDQLAKAMVEKNAYPADITLASVLDLGLNDTAELLLSKMKVDKLSTEDFNAAIKTNNATIIDKLIDILPADKIPNGAAVTLLDKNVALSKKVVEKGVFTPTDIKQVLEKHRSWDGQQKKEAEDLFSLMETKIIEQKKDPKDFAVMHILAENSHEQLFKDRLANKKYSLDAKNREGKTIGKIARDKASPFANMNGTYPATRIYDLLKTDPIFKKEMEDERHQRALHYIVNNDELDFGVFTSDKQDLKEVIARKFTHSIGDVEKEYTLITLAAEKKRFSDVEKLLHVDDADFRSSPDPDKLLFRYVLEHWPQVEGVKENQSLKAEKRKFFNTARAILNNYAQKGSTINDGFQLGPAFAALFTKDPDGAFDLADGYVTNDTAKQAFLNIGEFHRKMLFRYFRASFAKKTEASPLSVWYQSFASKKLSAENFRFVLFSFMKNHSDPAPDKSTWNLPWELPAKDVLSFLKDFMTTKELIDKFQDHFLAKVVEVLVPYDGKVTWDELVMLPDGSQQTIAGLSTSLGLKKTTDALNKKNTGKK